MDQHLFHKNKVLTNRLIYTPSAFAKTSLLHLQEVGTLTALTPHVSHRENLSSYLFFVVTDGSGRLSYEDKSYELHKGDCVFIDCKKSYFHQTGLILSDDTPAGNADETDFTTIHRLESISAGHKLTGDFEDLWTLKWAHFYGPTMNSIYEKYLERGGLPAFTPKSSEIFVSLMDDLYVTAGTPSYIRDMKICEHLTTLLTNLMEESWHPDSSKKIQKRTQNLQYMKDYIDAYFFEKLSLESLAEGYFFNKYHLSRSFKEQFGTTVNGYINQVRITNAKDRLRYTDDSIESIAEQCGFDDANYFSRAFKKVEGVTPSQYRKSW